MRIFSPNLIDAATISGSSQASSDLSASNVAHEFKSKVWRTGTSAAAETVTFDLATSQAATSAIIFAHTLLNTDTLIQLRKSTDNFVANDVLVGSFVWTSAAMLLTFSSASSRYWRIAFTKAAAGVSRDIGRIFIGTYADIPLDGDGFESGPVDMSQSDRSEGGLLYTARRSQYRVGKFSMDRLSQSEASALKTFCDTVGTHTCFFIIASESIPSDEAGEILYVKATDLPKRKTTGFDDSGNLAWSGQLSAAEQL